MRRSLLTHGRRVARRFSGLDRYHQLMTWVGRRERATLLIVLLLSACAWAFVELADEVMEGETRTVDRRLLLALRVAGDVSDPLGPRWVEEMGRDITALGGMAVLVLITLATLGYLWLLRKSRTMLVVFVAVAGAWIFSMSLKMLFDRPRPDLVPHGSHVYTASFPSGHAMLSAATYLTLGALLARVHPQRRLRAYFLLLGAMLSIIVGISRVYLGVHWPSDVLAGWTLGAAWALLCWFVVVLLQRRGEVEAEEEP
jgi:undecaprenyl-diphosphatase